jgi:hypothetical protein
LKKIIGEYDPETLDAILYGIGNNKTDDEIVEELNKIITPRYVKEIRSIVNRGFIMRDGPIASP